MAVSKMFFHVELVDDSIDGSCNASSNGSMSIFIKNSADIFSMHTDDDDDSTLFITAKDDTVTEYRNTSVAFRKKMFKKMSEMFLDGIGHYDHDSNQMFYLTDVDTVRWFHFETDSVYILTTTNIDYEIELDRDNADRIANLILSKRSDYITIKNGLQLVLASKGDMQCFTCCRETDDTGIGSKITNSIYAKYTEMEDMYCSIGEYTQMPNTDTVGVQVVSDEDLIWINFDIVESYQTGNNDDGSPFIEIVFENTPEPYDITLENH